MGGAWTKLLITTIVQFVLAIVWPLVSYFGLRAWVNPSWPMAVIDSITVLSPMVVLFWTWVSYWQYVRSWARKMETESEGASAKEVEKQGPVLQRLELELQILRLRVTRGLCLTWSFNLVLLAVSVLLRLVFAEVGQVGLR
jgi:hypothetical protein